MSQILLHGSDQIVQINFRLNPLQAELFNHALSATRRG